jgi:parvulin-like peptidyl-prolyl isomerase
MDTNIESKEKEVAPKMTHEETKKDEGVGGDKPKVISVKMAIIIAVIIIIGALLFYCKSLFIAATINGSPISRLAVISELEKTSGKQVLDGIITKRLLSDAAKKQGVVITAEDLNAEIAKIEDQVKAQGGTLDDMLAAQGMTRKDLTEQITLQKELEKLLADKLTITDEEIAKFLVDNKVTVPKGEETKYKDQVREQLRGQKLNETAKTYLDTLHADASIKYFVTY